MNAFKVDDLAPEVWRDAPSPKVMRRRMYVGGLSSKLRRRAQNAAVAAGDGAEKDDDDGNENYGFTVMREIVM